MKFSDDVYNLVTVKDRSEKALCYRLEEDIQLIRLFSQQLSVCIKVMSKLMLKLDSKKKSKLHVKKNSGISDGISELSLFS